LQEQLERLRTRISSCKYELDSFKKHYRLLYETGSELDEAVHDALMLLGFKETRRNRGVEKEDWVFEFNSVKVQILGIIEIKGVKKQISKDDIQQCEGWVTDYIKANKNAKGILIANQFRLESYSESKDARFKIEHDLNEYAVSRNICILPSCLLFEWINALMKGDTISRNQVESMLLSSSGMLTHCP
jgi:hypothetical protein